MTGPTISIIGTCQVVGLAAAFRHFLPGAQVSARFVLPCSDEEQEKITDNLKQPDIIISQFGDEAPLKRLRISRLREDRPDTIFVPPVTFRGFHPDCIYLMVQGRMLKEGALGGGYHSGIISSAYVLGLSAKRAERLYNALIYAELGYSDNYRIYAENTLNMFMSAGFDLTSFMSDAEKMGTVWMYTVNHPKIDILAHLAWVLGERIGLLRGEAPPLHGIKDALANSVHWPIFPWIGQRIGVTRSLDFVTPADANGVQSHLSIREFIDRAYAGYAAIPPETIRAAIPPIILKKMTAILV